MSELDHRRAILRTVIAEWEEPGTDFTVEQDAIGFYALIQYNGGRAPNEKWLTNFDTLDALLKYAANDEEWEPEAIIDLLTGEVYTPIRSVSLGAVERKLDPAEEEDET